MNEDLKKIIGQMKEDDNFSWLDIQEKFDTLKDINDIFYFLRFLVSYLKICSTTECNVFPQLLDLDNLRVEFDEYNSIESIEKVQDLNENAKKLLRNRFRDYIKKSKSVMSYIFALKTAKDTAYMENQTKLTNFLDIIEKLNKNNFPIPVEISGAVNNYLNQESYSLDLENPDLVAKAKKIQNDFKELKKKQ